MICCIAIASVVVLAVRFWRLITLQPMRTADAFPPVAKRFAPGEITSKNTIDDSLGPNGSYTTNRLLVFYAGSIGAYFLLTEWLLSSGGLHADYQQPEWFYRSALYIGGCIYFLLMSVFPGRKKQTLNGKQLKGSMITILGIVFTILSIADFHMFQVLQFQGSAHQYHHNHRQLFFTPEYIALHGLAFAPVIIGQILFHHGKSMRANTCT